MQNLISFLHNNSHSKYFDMAPLLYMQVDNEEFDVRLSIMVELTAAGAALCTKSKYIIKLD